MDTIANYFTIIRNAHMVGHKSISLSSSRLLVEISKVLKDEGYIKDYSVVEDNKKATLTTELKYYRGRPVIEKITRVSKCSCRQYVKAKEIETVCSGLGISILSTPQGVMTGATAKQKNVGGEVICKVW